MKKLISICVSVVLCGSLTAQNSFNINLLYQWNDTSLLSTSAHNNRYNEIWGLSLNGREYAVIGSTMGTHIFDITDPLNVDTAVFIPGAATGNYIIHRDYHDYNGYLYIVCDEDSQLTQSTLQIVDLSFLPGSAPIVYDSDTLIGRSHNIFIDSVKARLYACGVRPNYKQLKVYSLNDPVNPVFLGSYNKGEHDVYVRNDTAYLNDGTSGLFVVDFSVIGSPQVLGSFVTYPDTNRYNHSGWLNGSGTVYAVADEKFGYDINILDVSNLSNISILSTLSSGVNPLSMPHNLIIKDDFLYISYYNDGLYIFDIYDPANPVMTGYYDTSTEPHVQGEYRGAWGVYPLLPSGLVLVSDMQSGLYVFDVLPATGISGTDFQSSSLIYPNPTFGMITIRTQKKIAKNSVISIYDRQGRLVKQIDISASGMSEFNVDIAGLPDGLYILKIMYGKEAVSHKILKSSN